MFGLAPFIGFACRPGETGQIQNAPQNIPQDIPVSDTAAPATETPDTEPQTAPSPDPLHILLARAAEARTLKQVTYDPAYVRLAYPGGNPPDDRGVCSDVVIRAYRGANIDLQVKVHEDMRDHFSAYPSIWGLSRPDRNIDHRRVPNLETFFRRMQAELPANTQENNLQPGDLVAWRINDQLPHIGVVSTRRAPSGKVLIVHNIGRGPELAPCFDVWPRTGVYRYRPWVE